MIGAAVTTEQQLLWGWAQRNKNFFSPDEPWDWHEMMHKSREHIARDHRRLHAFFLFLNYSLNAELEPFSASRARLIHLLLACTFPHTHSPGLRKAIWNGLDSRERNNFSFTARNWKNPWVEAVRDVDRASCSLHILSEVCVRYGMC